MEAFFNEYLAYGLIGNLGYELGTVQFFLMAVACIIVPYLVGSINFAIIFSKVFHHGDVREHGSGNAGSTNMLRTYGARAALFTLIFDMLKTVLAIGFAGFLLGFYYVPGAVSISEVCYIAGLFAVIGHVFPIYYQGKGGKGVL